MIRKRILAILLAVVMTAGLAACGGNAQPDTASSAAPAESGTASVAPPPEPVNEKVLVIGVDGTFEEKWNPFIADSAYDSQVLEQIFAAVQQFDRDGVMQDYAGSVSYVENADGTVLYTVTIKPDLKFSDGTPITIDDYIYSLYVHADPSFNGPERLITSDIRGVKEYYYDDPNYSAKIAEFEAAAEAYATENITFETFLEYARATNLDGWWSPDAIEDEFIPYIGDEGYGDKLAAIDATNPDQVLEIVAQIEYDNYLEYYDAYNWYLDGAKAGYAAGNLEDGVDVPEIEGIKKIDDLTCTVLYNSIDIYADRGLGGRNGMGYIVPSHYYGEFDKGDVSKILANMDPKVASGPYVWNGFSDNIVTCTSNPNFFMGEPKVGTVRWQYIPQADIITNLASGAIDIANPTGNQQNVAELDANGIEYDLLDNAGYGYLGMNCQNLDKNVRKGLLSLMNRRPSVEGYYGPIAQVIERPMTTIVAEYPRDAAPYYTYSRDEALKYFEAAGYTQKDGKLVDANGKQLTTNVYIGGDGQGDHAGYAMLVQAAEDLKTLGGELQIQDVNFAVLQGAMNDGTADMFVLAWSEVYDCNKTTQFRSDGGQNRFRFSDPQMDRLLDTIIQTIDLTERKKLVAEMLDMAMDNCIEFPLYQRKNILAYNQNTVDMSTIPDGSTAFYDYKRELWNVDVLS